MSSKEERNARVQKRWDELWREGKHGHYETLFRVVREEVERAERERDVYKAQFEKDYNESDVQALMRVMAELEEARALLKEALRCMKEAKHRWAPSTTNSDADACIARIDAALKEQK